MMPLHHCVSQLRPTRLCENVAESATTMTVWPDDSFAPTYQPRVRHRGQRNTSATKSRTWLSPEAVACDLVEDLRRRGGPKPLGCLLGAANQGRPRHLLGDVSRRLSARLSRKTCFSKQPLALPYQACLEREAWKSIPALLLKEVLPCSGSRLCFLV